MLTSATKLTSLDAASSKLSIEGSGQSLSYDEQAVHKISKFEIFADVSKKNADIMLTSETKLVYLNAASSFLSSCKKLQKIVTQFRRYSNLKNRAI